MKTSSDPNVTPGAPITQRQVLADGLSLVSKAAVFALAGLAGWALARLAHAAWEWWNTSTADMLTNLSTAFQQAANKIRDIFYR